MKFFLDENLPYKFAPMLMALDGPENQVLPLRVKFPLSTPDEVWFAQLEKEGDWVVLSGDFRISKSPRLREAWKASKLTTFFLAKGWMNQKLWDQAWRLVRWWPLITEQAARVARGAVYLVPVNPGKFQTLER